MNISTITSGQSMTNPSLSNSHIHILGIAGTMTASLAVALKQAGARVTGSDQPKIFPPISTTLKKADIKINITDIDHDINQAIIGSSYNLFENTKEEFKQIKQQKIPYLSATKYIAQNIIKPNSIIVAGSFGKTTITSLLAWIFHHTKLKPSYMFGGSSKNKFSPVKITDSNWSIVEGDESIHGLDKTAKFLYYPAKYLIITSADWEHKDSYPDAASNLKTFKKLVQKLPSDGVFLVNQQSPSALSLAQYSPAKVISYNTPESDYFLEKTIPQKNFTTLIIRTPSGIIKTNTTLIGQFNFENILAAVALSDYLAISPKIIAKSIFSYRGIRRRLELVAKPKNILFFDDFAQSGNRIKSTLTALNSHYPQKKIKVLYQAHASFSQYKSSLDELKNAFNLADEIVLTQLKFNHNINKKNRNTAKDFRDCLGSKLIYLPLKTQIMQYYKHSLTSNDILIYMSSGGLEGNRIFKSVINLFK